LGIGKIKNRKIKNIMKLKKFKKYIDKAVEDSKDCNPDIEIRTHTDRLCKIISI